MQAYTSKPKLIAIVGPTASGKTELAVALALRLRPEQAKKLYDINGVEIISADSRQIYRGMDIGTGKPTKKEMAGIPHHLLDIRNPNEAYAAAKYKEDALAMIHGILERNKLPILAGGTGLYVRTIIDNLGIPNVPPNPALREKLERELEKNGLGALFKKLAALDPEVEYIVDRNNPCRVIRALEIALGTQKSFSASRKKGPKLFDVLELGIALPKELLYGRIATRVDEMFRRGLIAEVKRLVKKYGGDCHAFDAIGYREVIAWHVAHGMWHIGNAERQKIAELIKKNTRAYAKRQMTWFKKDTRIQWVRSKREAEEIVRKFLATS